MHIRYPDSFLKLLLIGFAFAIFPLLWAFINANISYGNIAKQSEATISQAVETTRLTRALQEKSSFMERSARQYYVLKDVVLFDNYQQAYDTFDDTAAQLRKHLNNSALENKLIKLQNDAASLHKIIIENKATVVDTPAFLDGFVTLTSQINEIIAENNTAIDMRSTAFAAEARETQKSLFLQSLILIPLALIVAGVIAFLLARPIRRMDSAIRNLGEGLYEEPISIDGPGDLRQLGRRLDWLRKELNELNAQKQQFLRHVSHELKTPLTAIREATELLHDGIGGTLSEQQVEIIKITRENSIRLQKMIENLLNFTKIESMNNQSSHQAIDLEKVIHQVLAAHALTINNKKMDVRVRTQIEGKLISNEEKLSIILDNLISNAVNYTPEAGQINILSRQEKDWFMVEVIDNGPGLAKADYTKIFDPFYRGHSNHHGLINGSGLGLTIVKEIVATLDGNISLVPSKNGAHFSVRLPRNITTLMEI